MVYVWSYEVEWKNGRLFQNRKNQPFMLPKQIVLKWSTKSPPKNPLTSATPLPMWHLYGVPTYLFPTMVVPLNIIEFYLLKECLKLIDHLICGGYILWFIYLWHQFTSFLHFSSTTPDQQSFLVRFTLSCDLVNQKIWR